MMEGLNLWLLEQINSMVKRIGDRVIQRINLMGQPLDKRAEVGLMQQIIGPTVSGMINVAIMQHLIESSMTSGLFIGENKKILDENGKFDLSKLIDEETIINDITANLALSLPQAKSNLAM